MLTIRPLIVALFAISASAQAYQWNITLSSENAGASTRVSWTYSGPAYFTETPTQPNIAALNAFAVGGLDVSGGDLPLFNTSPAPYFDLDTGVFLTNMTTAETVESTQVYFAMFGSYRFMGFRLLEGSGPNGGLAVTYGQSVAVAVPSAASFVINQEFSVFNPGTWSLTDANGSVRSLSVSAAVPEASTYGLMLGGLALAGAAIRRRKTSR